MTRDERIIQAVASRINAINATPIEEAVSHPSNSRQIDRFIAPSHMSSGALALGAYAPIGALAFFNNQQHEMTEQGWMPTQGLYADQVDTHGTFWQENESRAYERPDFSVKKTMRRRITV